MPRFFFHIEGGPDDLGADLPTIASAKCEAARYAGRLLCDEAETFWSTAEINMKVTDERGLVLFTIHVGGTDAPIIRVSPKVPA